MTNLNSQIQVIRYLYILSCFSGCNSLVHQLQIGARASLTSICCKFFYSVSIIMYEKYKYHYLFAMATVTYHKPECFINVTSRSTTVPICPNGDMVRLHGNNSILLMLNINFACFCCDMCIIS